MIGHMRHGSPPRLMALQSILSPNRPESLPTPSAGVRMKAPDPRHGPLHTEVVALDPLLQVLGDVMHRRARQQAGFPALRDRGWIGARPIGADPVGGEQRLLLQHPAEE